MTTERLADPADVALAHALWDAVHATHPARLERPDDVEFHIGRAREVRHFLRIRGFDVFGTAFRQKP